LTDLGLSRLLLTAVTVAAAAVAPADRTRATALPWVIPAEVEAAGAPVVAYTAAPSWAGGSGCAGGFAPGAEELALRLAARFSQIARVFGYECRPNTANVTETSQHGTGRAIDLAIPTRDGDADNERGDAVANWLVENSSRIGVQLVIWDRTVWVGYLDTPKARRYTGPDPHADHIHVEINLAGASRETPFFAAP
jgi:hypothetical protein